VKIKLRVANVSILIDLKRCFFELLFSSFRCVIGRHTSHKVMALAGVCLPVFFVFSILSAQSSFGSILTLPDQIHKADIELVRNSKQVIQRLGLKGTSSINVTAHNGYLLLSGIVASAKVKNNVTKALIAANGKTMRRLYNELQVDTPVVWSSMSDVVLQSAIEASFGLSPNSLKITVTQGVVYVMGVVSPPHGDAIVNTIADTPNVKRVVSVLERVDDQAITSIQKEHEQYEEPTIYNIDRLKVTVSVNRKIACDQGYAYYIDLQGEIGADSSFAIAKIMENLGACQLFVSNIQPTKHVTVALSSGGGRLSDGYLLGRLFRAEQVHTIIAQGAICASSCAVAFLGGVERALVSDAQIMFHSPYFIEPASQTNKRVNCDVGDNALKELFDYYVDMVGVERGARLFDRTMRYCSSNDGWLLTGNPAALLYGISTIEVQSDSR
jgi:osmotically-inducible protein OsmY/ATP-dependent protease ClpP protease subunit